MLKQDSIAKLMSLEEFNLAPKSYLSKIVLHNTVYLVIKSFYHLTFPRQEKKLLLVQFKCQKISLNS